MEDSEEIAEVIAVDRVRERPGGRSADIRGRVLAALDELTQERPFSELSVAELAERSGVARSTIHRRWGDLLGVMAELVGNEISPSRYMADAEQADIRSWAIAVRDGLPGGPRQNPFDLVLQHLNRLPDAEMRRGAAGGLLRRLMPLSPDVTEPHEIRELIDIVFAPIYLAHVMGLDDITDADIDRFVARYEAERAARRTS